jgi:hypothetical protein
MPNFRDLALQSTKEVLDYYERIGFIGIQEAYGHLANEPEQPLLTTIQEAVQIVCQRVLMECGAMG